MIATIAPDHTATTPFLMSLPAGTLLFKTRTIGLTGLQAQPAPQASMTRKQINGAFNPVAEATVAAIGSAMLRAPIKEPTTILITPAKIQISRINKTGGIFKPVNTPAMICMPPILFKHVANIIANKTTMPRLFKTSPNESKNF